MATAVEGGGREAIERPKKDDYASEPSSGPDEDPSERSRKVKVQRDLFRLEAQFLQDISKERKERSLRTDTTSMTSSATGITDLSLHMRGRFVPPNPEVDDELRVKTRLSRMKFKSLELEHVRHMACKRFRYSKQQKFFRVILFRWRCAALATSLHRERLKLVMPVVARMFRREPLAHALYRWKTIRYKALGRWGRPKTEEVMDSDDETDTSSLVSGASGWSASTVDTLPVNMDTDTSLYLYLQGIVLVHKMRFTNQGFLCNVTTDEAWEYIVAEDVPIELWNEAIVVWLTKQAVRGKGGLYIDVDLKGLMAEFKRQLAKAKRLRLAANIHIGHINVPLPNLHLADMAREMANGVRSGLHNTAEAMVVGMGNIRHNLAHSGRELVSGVKTVASEVRDGAKELLSRTHFERLKLARVKWMNNFKLHQKDFYRLYKELKRLGNVDVQSFLQALKNHPTLHIYYQKPDDYDYFLAMVDLNPLDDLDWEDIAEGMADEYERGYPDEDEDSTSGSEDENKEELTPAEPEVGRVADLLGGG